MLEKNGKALEQIITHTHVYVPLVETVGPNMLGLQIVLPPERAEAGGGLGNPAMALGVFHLILPQASKLSHALSQLSLKKSSSMGNVATIIPFYR